VRNLPQHSIIEIMDPNKKFLYFNADGAALSGPTEASATTVPVSASAGMEVTNASTLKMIFKESVETDTLDVTMSRTADSDPREIMESIVNQINYSREPTLVIGDNSTGEYADHRLSNVSITFADHGTIKLHGPVQSTITSANAAGAGAPGRSSNVGMYNGEIITTIFVDLATSGKTCTASATADHAIGVTGGGAAYITQVTQAVNGIVYAAELICLEAPLGASTTVGLSSSSTASVTQGADATGNEKITEAVQSVGDRTQLNLADAANNPVHNAGITDTEYLYLYHGGGAAGDYTAGRFLIRLYGANPDGLEYND